MCEFLFCFLFFLFHFIIFHYFFKTFLQFFFLIEKNENFFHVLKFYFLSEIFFFFFIHWMSATLLLFFFKYNFFLFQIFFKMYIYLYIYICFCFLLFFPFTGSHKTGKLSLIKEDEEEENDISGKHLSYWPQQSWLGGGWEQGKGVVVGVNI